MSDEFMNGIGGEPENTNETPQGYTNPENSDDQNYKAPETNGETAQEYQQPEQNQTSYYGQTDYSQPQYDPNNLGKPDYSQMNYNSGAADADYNQNGYGQPAGGQNYNQNGYGQPNGGVNYNQNGYNQNGYNQNGYNQPPYGAATKSDSTGFGIASLVLGIISIFTFFCCINYILAVIAIVLGIVQIVKSSKKGLAIGGIVTAVISIIGATIFWVLIGSAGASEMGPMQDYMEEYMQDYMQQESNAF